MGVRVEFEVYKLPDTFITSSMHYAFEQDGDRKDKHGNVRMKMEQKLVEERGGFLIKVRGKPGHSIRVTSIEQAIALKLLPPEAKELRPRLINTETGEECDEHGVPLSVVAVVGKEHGAIDTDVDVDKGDSTLEIDHSDAAESAVGSQIEKME